MLKPWQTQPPTMYIAVAFCLPRQSSNECSFNLFNTEDLRAHCLVLGLKRRGKWKEIPNGGPFARYLGKGAMTRAYGYIYTIFGPEASHASLSKPLIKLEPARWAGSGSRLANEDTDQRVNVEKVNCTCSHAHKVHAYKVHIL